MDIKIGEKVPLLTLVYSTAMGKYPDHNHFRVDEILRHETATLQFCKFWLLSMDSVEVLNFVKEDGIGFKTPGRQSQTPGGR